MRETTRGALRRFAPVAGWVAGCELMILIGAALQGVAGAWVAGGALYLIMSREWSREERIANYEIHLPVTAGALFVGIVTELLLIALGGAHGLTLYWEQLPLGTILLGALHNSARDRDGSASGTGPAVAVAADSARSL